MTLYSLRAVKAWIRLFDYSAEGIYRFGKCVLCRSVYRFSIVVKTINSILRAQSSIDFQKNGGRIGLTVLAIDKKIATFMNISPLQIKKPTPIRDSRMRSIFFKLDRHIIHLYGRMFL